METSAVALTPYPENLLLSAKLLNGHKRGVRRSKKNKKKNGSYYSTQCLMWVYHSIPTSSLRCVWYYFSELYKWGNRVSWELNDLFKVTAGKLQAQS